MRKMAESRVVERTTCACVQALEGRVLLAGDGLTGIYFNSPDLTGAAVAARVDPTVNFVWNGSPAAKVNADNFSVLWRGQLMPRYTGLYNFLTTSDDGVRLLINGIKVIDHWTRHAATTDTGTAVLTAGQRVNIELQFFDTSGGATAKLFWKSKVQPQEIIPTSQLYAGKLPVITPPPVATAPSVPGSFAAAALSQSQIKLSWQDVANETGYKLERSPYGTNNWSQIAGPAANATSYTDGSLAANTTYFYRLRAANTTGNSAYTAVMSAKTQAVVPPPLTPPATPAGFAAAALSASQIKLSWQDVASETGYALERSADGVNSWSQINAPAANATSYMDSNLASNTTYYYRLRAGNPAGNSAYTAVASAKTQAIVTPPPANGAYQPDAIIQIHHDTSFVGDNIYNATGAGQTKDGVADFYGTVFKIRVYNDGKNADSFIITGPNGDANWRVAYYDSFVFGWNGGKNISADVDGAGWNTGNVDPASFAQRFSPWPPPAATCVTWPSTSGPPTMPQKWMW